MDRAKIVDYLLSADHPDGRSKAAFFQGLGYDRERWSDLATALREHGAANEVSHFRTTDHGVLYSVDGTLKTPVGQPPRIRTVWLMETPADAPRLVTAYPLRRNHVH